MVFLGRLLASSRASKRKYKFIDSLRIYVQGGSGGTGTPKYGGIGGQGGCVYCVGSEKATFQKLLRQYPTKMIVAKHGENSVKRKLAGSPGEDVELKVPLGIRVFSENKKYIGKIDKEDETLILARGGVGGDEKNGFFGREGQKWFVTLDLRLIADVGFVGFPNAGKSTILKAISRASPKIAAYPFTTIRPNIGMLTFSDRRTISLADLPGLIEGAHKNIGMGHEFLKHVERTRLLMLIVDVQGFSLTAMHNRRTCFETILLLNKEIELYNPELLKKPALLVINKMDTENSEKILTETKENLKNIKETVKNMPEEFHSEEFLEFNDVLAISAKHSPDDIERLRNRIRTLLDEVSDEYELDEVRESMRGEVRERGPILT